MLSIIWEHDMSYVTRDICYALSVVHARRSELHILYHIIVHRPRAVASYGLF